ncbi:MAG: phenylacetate--CoA ligase family protein [Candidatus Omnitrophota bacterium]
MNVISLINQIPFGNPAQKGHFLYKNVPAGILDSLETLSFRQTIAFVAEHSPFYKRKFKELGVDPRAVIKPEDLGNFFTTAEDIRQNPEEFICQKPDTAFETTGTTSKRPKRVYFSRSEVREVGWAGAVGLWGVGVRPQDRVASAFDYSFWVSGPVLAASCAVLGCFHVEAARMNPDDFYERLKDYKITVIVGDPSWLLRLSEIAEKKGPWPLKLMIGGGENFAEEARRFCEKVWKADFLLSYGQTEAFGAIGMESLDKQGYHLNEFHNRFEIINTDDQNYGELVYTTLNRRVMPLVRYRSGDITRFLGGSTKSGLPGRRIAKLRGRVNDWTATAIGNFAPWIFEPLFSEIEGIGPDWQVVIDKRGPKDLLEFHVENEHGGRSESELREEFFSRFKKHLTDAWKGYEMGLCFMDLKAHPKGSLRGGRKLSRLVDRRRF